jgi:hypothetical protein
MHIANVYVHYSKLNGLGSGRGGGGSAAAKACKLGGLSRKFASFVRVGGECVCVHMCAKFQGLGQREGR